MFLYIYLYTNLNTIAIWYSWLSTFKIHELALFLTVIKMCIAPFLNLNLCIYYISSAGFYPDIIFQAYFMLENLLLISYHIYLQQYIKSIGIEI